MVQKQQINKGDGAIMNDTDIRRIYTDISANFNQQAIQQLELNQTFEKLLWPSYDLSSCRNKELILLIVLLINEKCRQNANTWETFQKSGDFSLFFNNVIRLALEKNISVKERIFLLRFVIHSFNSVEIELVRQEIKRYVSLPIWVSLSGIRLEQELCKIPKLRKLWKKIEKNDKALSIGELEKINFERRFLTDYILNFFEILKEIPAINSKETLSNDQNLYIKYCERFLEFLIDLETLLPTRRFSLVLLDDLHVITIARLSNLFSRPEEGKLFRQLLQNLKFYLKFEIDHLTGEALSDSQITLRHMNKFSHLQKTIFRIFGDDAKFRLVYLASISSMDNRSSFLKHFLLVNDEDLIQICQSLGLGMDRTEQFDKICSFCPDSTIRTVLLEVMVDHFVKAESQMEALNSLPLYPTEEIIWDDNLVPSEYNESCLALPKLNIQFLTMHDYLLRNFHLFRLESTYQIRQNIESAVSHMKPWAAEDESIMFGGWARMAIPIESFSVTEIGKANIGENKPSRVKAEIVVNLNVKRSIKREWESLRKHDVCFLITVQPKVPPGTNFSYKEPFVPQVGLIYVRGCEIEGMLDSTGRIIDEAHIGNSEKPAFTSDYRTFKVLLDSNQYKVDMKMEQVEKIASKDLGDVYASFNILMRRKPNENNFKAVLETIRELMNTKFVVPDWLHDVILGYGEPAAAHYTNLPSNQELFPILDFFDTFINNDHVKESFEGYEVQLDSNKTLHESSLFKLKIEEEKKRITVLPYTRPVDGPNIKNQPKRNQIRFTPTQVSAIRAGIQHGLTMVVGPPGTGKTDLAVQIISNLYNNHPDQRTLIVTHSNQALNAIFEKIMCLNIDERHLLRLGRGEEELETEKDFSRYGRVNYVLTKRLQLLDLVGKLAQSLSITTDFAYTCETAGFFYLYNVLSKWEAFLYELKNSIDAATETSASLFQEKFPFAKFFSDVETIFTGKTYNENLKIAKSCFRYIRSIFTELDEFKAFEILRNGTERANYLLVKEAKIIAMTCTHAALKRKDLVALGFQYDNILMEESAQILEIETFIPLLLQNPEFGHNRLKRWIMIGDHQQLPPVIQNQTFQKFSNMEQSLFTRFVRLGVPTINLDKQARARPSISSLYRWRYTNLTDLELVYKLPEFNKPNPGFQFDYQLINVEDFNGVGESEPIPHFFQNLAEAEYVVAMFMYMRLLGYPSEKITILTTYNGQKFLIRDVVEQRCASNPFIGRPSKITTVDKFQGQQNDFILLSLVRTKTVGHIRDIRRLTVALSRARLGLYIFARQNLFASCYELQNTFKLLSNRPNTLKLIPNEFYFQKTDDLVSRVENYELIATMNDMQDMLKFVFDFYPKQVSRIQKEWPDWFDSIMNPKEQYEELEEVAEVEKVKEANLETENTIEEDQTELFEKLNEKDTGMDDDVELPSDNEEDRVQLPDDIAI